MAEGRDSKSRSAAEMAGALDPLSGMGPQSAHTLVIGRSAGERESVARAVHRFHRGEDGPFLRVLCDKDEALLRNALEAWLAGSPGENSPPLLSRLEGGSLFLDGVEALGAESQKLLLGFLDASGGDRGRGDSPGRPNQPWKGLLIVGSEQALRHAVRDRGFSPELATSLENVRIVLDPEDAAGP
ncbi:MAG: sigma 54-interacting transcriptional regulator [Candidatus Eiseniibacteriota bacterium]